MRLDMTPCCEAVGNPSLEPQGLVLDLEPQDVVADVDLDATAVPCGSFATPNFLQSESARVASIQAQPQVLPGQGRVWPELWGVTRAQIRQLLCRLRSDPAWRMDNSVYTVVQDYIIPWTRGTGLGYALMLNQDEPKEVNVMVSHAWGENAEDFFEALLRSTTEEDVIFVCALSIYQAEDGAGPSIEEQVGGNPSNSPFERVIRNIRMNGDQAGWRWRWRRTLKRIPLLSILLAIVLYFMPTILWGCVGTVSQCAKKRSHEIEVTLLLQWFLPYTADPVVSQWEWIRMPRWWGMIFPCSSIALLVCGALCYACHRRFPIYAGRMVAVPNNEVDIYSRLWCVYEIFVARKAGIGVQVARTLAVGGMKSSKFAVCSSEKDTQRIQREIESTPMGYAGIDKTVYKTMHGAMWDAIRVAFVYGVMISLFRVASARITTATETGIAEPVYILIQTSSPLASSFVVMALVYRLFRRSRGSPSACVVVGISGSLMLVGLALSILGMYMQDPHMVHGSAWLTRTRDVETSVEVDGLAIWFIRFGSCFVEDGFYMVMLLLCTHCSTCSSVVVRSLCLAAISTAVFISCTAFDLAGNLGLTSQLLYPAVVTGISKVAGHVLIPLYALTASATKWGVSTGARSAKTSCCISDLGCSSEATSKACDGRREGP
mmetsp:Transcript_80105/g.201539  ORF Transcript_80105/g.201539 Transcript_80105/m.201539 type:complete len:660 (-) Transcript_80105:367-2346(-)